MGKGASVIKFIIRPDFIRALHADDSTDNVTLFEPVSFLNTFPTRETSENGGSLNVQSGENAQNKERAEKGFYQRGSVQSSAQVDHASTLRYHSAYACHLSR